MSPGAGLKPSDAWKDTQVKKIQRTDSQKKEKRQRTLSLKTRKHTHSFKEKYRVPGGDLPADMEGVLERKQELQTGGKKATIRSWKSYHTVLCGQLLCFFKDKQCECVTIVYYASLAEVGVVGCMATAWTACVLSGYQQHWCTLFLQLVLTQTIVIRYSNVVPVLVHTGISVGEALSASDVHLLTTCTCTCSAL